ncbi:hypothetical protein DRJ48_05285 [Candidatus Woesearchaeota archaeon]|nr:MAG: hypothetical protein DRJ48_05285 [Candidatus Woesearchaeota archaeon]
MKREEKLRQTIESIKKDFVKFIESNPLLSDFVSIFVVGSFIGKDYKIDKVNDLDLRVIFKKVTYEKAELLKIFLEECKRNYSSKIVDICYSTVVGIAKPPYNPNKVTILIHLIYFDMREFQRLPKIHTNTYIKFHELLKGKELRELKSIELTIDNVINDFEGLKHCIEMLKTNKLKYFEWERVDSNFTLLQKERDIKEEELLECIKYALFKPIINFLNLKRTETNDIEKTYNLILSSKRFYDFPYKDVLIEFKRVALENAPFERVKQLRDKSIKFLIELEKYIRNFELREIMYEVEVVGIVPDLNAVKKNLLNTKHIFIKREKQVAIFLVKEGFKGVVRLTVSPESVILSYKGGGFGEIREEIESEVKDYKAIYRLFIKLGFKVDTHFFRTREYFTNSAQNLTIVLDETIGSPKLVEIERVIEDDKQKEKVLKELKEYALKFLKIKELVSREEFNEMLAQYKSKTKSQEVDFERIDHYLQS